MGYQGRPFKVVEGRGKVVGGGSFWNVKTFGDNIINNYQCHL